MDSRKQEDAKTQWIETNGNSYAYRRLGTDKGIPLVLLMHFRGTMDHWDPLLINGLASSRPVILFDNVGVGETPGDIPDTIDGMADHALAFLKALELDRIDLLGFSMGGSVAQTLAVRQPQLIRRLVLAGTGPGDGLHKSDPRVKEVAGAAVVKEEHMIFLFFPENPVGVAAGRAYWARIGTRQGGLPPMVSGEGVGRQAAALRHWNEPVGGSLHLLGEVDIPALVTNGSNDIMVSTEASIRMAQALPNAQLILFPNSGHGFLFQYAELFVEYLNIFLRADEG